MQPFAAPGVVPRGGVVRAHASTASTAPAPVAAHALGVIRPGQIVGRQHATLRVATQASKASAPSTSASTASPAVEQAGAAPAQPGLINHAAVVRDLNGYDMSPAKASTSGRVDPLGSRLIYDPRELDLIGDGLPVTFGVSPTATPAQCVRPYAKLCCVGASGRQIGQRLFWAEWLWPGAIVCRLRLPAKTFALHPSCSPTGASSTGRCSNRWVKARKCRCPRRTPSSLSG